MFHIILCEKATGIVLELDGKTRFLKTDGNIRPSIDFTTLQEAEERAFSLSENNNNLEIGIYDEKWSFIKRVVK